jgi:hypothetical protein
VRDLVWGLAHLESDGLSCDSTVGLRSTDVETNGNKSCEYSTKSMLSRPLPNGHGPTSGLVQLAQVDKLPIHGCEDPAFPYAQARIGFCGLGHTHRRWRRLVVVWHLAQ